MVICVFMELLFFKYFTVFWWLIFIASLCLSLYLVYYPPHLIKWFIDYILQLSPLWWLFKTIGYTVICVITQNVSLKLWSLICWLHHKICVYIIEFEWAHFHWSWSINGRGRSFLVASHCQTCSSDIPRKMQTFCWFHIIICAYVNPYFLKIGYSWL